MRFGTTYHGLTTGEVLERPWTKMPVYPCSPCSQGVPAVPDASNAVDIRPVSLEPGMRRTSCAVTAWRLEPSNTPFELHRLVQGREGRQER